MPMKCSMTASPGSLAFARSSVTSSRFLASIESDVAYAQLNDIVDAACTISHNEIRYRARLERHLGNLPPVTVDRAKLTQSLVNILLFSAHSIDEGDADANRIDISTRREDGFCVIEIRDTGRGLRRHEREHLFDPLLSSGKAPDTPGIGLSLSAELVRQHGGDIQVNANPGGGSCYRIRLPEVNDLRDLAPSPEPEGSGALGPRRRYRVLLVDDDALVRRAFCRLLVNQCDLIEAEGGQAALELIAQDDRFDVILCDIMMPRMDGVAFYERVRDERPRLAEQFVFVSGGTFTRRTHDFVDNTGHIVLEKPVRRELLMAVIERVASSQTSRPNLDS